MSISLKNLVTVLAAAMFTAALFGCSSSSNNNRAAMPQTELGEDELTPDVIMNLRNQIAMLMGQVATLMGQADTSPTDLQALRGQITDLTGQVMTLTGRTDISPTDLQALRGQITDLQVLRDQIATLMSVHFNQILEDSLLVRSTADPIRATDTDDTLAMLLPDPNNRFAPLVSVIRRDFGEQTSNLATDFSVTAISSDGANGFRVTYFIGAEERTVHFEAADYDPSDAQFYKEVDGFQYYFWDYLGSFRGPEKNKGSSQYKYFDVNGINRSAQRNFIVYGARTEAANMPSGTASYGGWMYADTWDVTDPSLGARGRMNGRLNLTANFGASSLEGIIRHIRARRPGESSYSRLSDTTAHFEIGDGQIVDGQFVATLTGMGDQNAPADETVRGYNGSVLGEFYGPAAEEVGGVLNASSDAHNRVLAGYFAGRQLDSTVPEGDLSVLSVAVDRDFSGLNAHIDDVAEVAAIESDDVGGFRVTYLVDGVEQEIHLEARDYGSHPDFSTNYHDRIGDRSYWLWNPVSYSLVPEFDYFDVKGWSVQDWEAGSTASLHISRGFAVYGSSTEAADLPSGTATYAGRMYAETQPLDDPGGAARGFARGSLTLNVDFGQSTVGGMIDNMYSRAPGQSYAATNGHIMIENGMIADSGFIADLTGAQDHADFTGDMEGQFYGPAAAEVGGVLKGTYSAQNRVATGYFGGSKQ